MKTLVLYSLSVSLCLLPLSAMSESKYQQTEDAKTVRNGCWSYWEGSDVTGLARCLGLVHRNKFPKKHVCDVVDIFAGEVCANRWGVFGQDHRNCKYSTNGGGFIYNYSNYWFQELGAGCT